MKTLILSTNVYLAQQSIELGMMMLPFLGALMVVSWMHYREDNDSI